MSKRFLIMSAGLVGLTFLQFADFRTREITLLDVFFVLFFMIVMFGVGLWPTRDRDQRVDMRMGRTNWGDRIDLEKARGKLD
jgi:hypothetical protein